MADFKGEIKAVYRITCGICVATKVLDAVDNVGAGLAAIILGWVYTSEHGWVCPEDACREEAGLKGRTDEKTRVVRTRISR